MVFCQNCGKFLHREYMSEKTKKNKLWYYLILILIIIIILSILLWILSIEKDELIKINESLLQSAGSVRGGTFTHGTAIIIYLIIPIIILVIYCIKKIKGKK